MSWYMYSMLSASEISVNNLLNPIPIAAFDDVTVSLCMLNSQQGLPDWVANLKPDTPIPADVLFTDTSSTHKFARLTRIRAVYGIAAASLHVSVRHKDYIGRTMLLTSQREAQVYTLGTTPRELAATLTKPVLLTTSSPGLYLLFDVKLYVD